MDSRYHSPQDASEARQGLARTSEAPLFHGALFGTPEDGLPSDVGETVQAIDQKLALLEELRNRRQSARRVRESCLLLGRLDSDVFHLRLRADELTRNDHPLSLLAANVARDAEARAEFEATRLLLDHRDSARRPE